MALKPEDRNALIAAAIILAALSGGFLAMPALMRAISGAGPYVAVAVAILFVSSLFIVLWLRARWHKGRDR